PPHPWRRGTLAARRPRTRRPRPTTATPVRATGPRRLSRQLGAIAHARLGHDELGPVGTRLDLATQIRDVHPEVLLRTARRRSPPGFEDLLMRVRASPVRPDRAQ